jgi:hypothetical protein
MIAERVAGAYRRVAMSRFSEYTLRIAKQVVARCQIFVLWRRLMSGLLERER